MMYLPYMVEMKFTSSVFFDFLVEHYQNDDEHEEEEHEENGEGSEKVIQPAYQINQYLTSKNLPKYLPIGGAVSNWRRIIQRVIDESNYDG